MISVEEKSGYTLTVSLDAAIKKGLNQTSLPVPAVYPGGIEPLATLQSRNFTLFRWQHGVPPQTWTSIDWSDGRVQFSKPMTDCALPLPRIADLINQKLAAT